MVDRLVAVDDADYALPDPVLGALSVDVGDAASTVGGAVKSVANTVAVSVAEAIFKPEWYGALGDGTTDDTTAFVSALTAARAVSGRLVLTFGKTYILSGTLNPLGVTIDGRGATLKIKSGITQTFNLFQPSGPFTLIGATINLNKAGTTDPATTNGGMAVYVYNATGWAGSVVLRDVKVINGYQVGIRFGTLSSLTDSSSAPLSAALLDGVTVDGCKWGIWAYATRGVTITNCTVQNTTSDGVYDYLSRDTKVTGCRVRSCAGHGIVSAYSYGFSANNNDVNDAGNIGIVIGGGTVALSEARNFTISNNRIKASASNNISVDTTKTGFAGVVQSCYGAITGNVSDGATIHGIYMHNAQYMTVTGNICRGNANGGIAFDSKFVAIAGNTLIQNAYGMKFLGNTGDYGSHQVGRNVVTANTTANYYFDPVGATNTTLDLQGTGSPEGVYAAPPGSRFARTDGGAGTSSYVKESGVSSTGWVAK